MPTARELLEQADALMRRNRSVGGGESGIPVLTDSVPDARAEPSRWGPATRERNSAALRVPAGDARIAHSNDHASPRSVSPRAHSETAANSADAPETSAPFAEKVAVPADAERWRALAEQISMQVLQRLDLFIDTGLKAQLAAHLQPIVERAGAGLVETINDHVGQLVRTYVAEAIEREIAQWRQQQR